MSINQNISAFPTAPNSSTDTPIEFNAKADAYVNHQSNVFTGEVNQWAAEANALAAEIDNIVATLPDGTINDTVVASDSAYSSQKTEATYGKKEKTDNLPNDFKMVGTEVEVRAGTAMMATAKVDSGVWIMYADGTLIQTGYVSSALTSYEMAYPIPFLSGLHPYITLTPKITEVNLNSGYMAVVDWPINGATHLKISATHSSIESNFVAIGRWKDYD